MTAGRATGTEIGTARTDGPDRRGGHGRPLHTFWRSRFSASA